MQTVTFDYALDVLESLPEKQQDSLFEIVKKRRRDAKCDAFIRGEDVGVAFSKLEIEQHLARQARRHEFFLEIQKAKAEYLRDELKPMTIDEIMEELKDQ
jgi:hypothetical protein